MALPGENLSQKELCTQKMKFIFSSKKPFLGGEFRTIIPKKR